MRKQFLIPMLLVISLWFTSMILAVNAHPGGTDSKGGHTNSNTGEYHYHHGYSAHNHSDMDGDGDVDCPYDFVDKTNHSSKSNNSSKTNKDNNKSQKATTAPTSIQSKKSSTANAFDAEFVTKIVVGVLVVLFWIVPMFFSKR